MELKEYQELYELGDSHFWFVGRKMIVTRLIKQINKLPPHLNPGVFHVPLRGEEIGGGGKGNSHSIELNSPLILDVGCGTGDMIQLLNNYGSAVGIDSSAVALGFCRRRQLSHLSQGSIMNLPFKEGKFDLLTSFDVLSHNSIVDPKAALSEFNRVLKDNGYLLIFDVACRLLRSGHDIVYEIRERYNKSGLIVDLEDAGFTILKISYANFSIFPIVFFLRTMRRLFSNSKSKPKSDLKPVSPLVNLFLINVLKIESLLIQWINFPIGSSIICLAKKDKSL